MSEIELLYKNAEIEINKNRCKDYSCTPYCDKYKKCHKPFTKEKQLDLVKWIFRCDYYIAYCFWCNKYGFGIQYQDENTLIEDEKFEVALAKTIGFIWGFISEKEKEKEQIRSILNER